MNRNAIRKIYLLALAILLASAGTLYAGKKPKITRHDATLLQNAIKITVEWQAEKPVVLLKATVGGESKEVELDEFDDNTRDRHGFYGEADVSIALEPYEAFVQKDYIPYVIQIRDDLGRKSEITGRVRVKITEAEDTYTEDEGRYVGEMPARSDDSGEYRTRHIIRDVLDIVKQHTARPPKGDSDHRPGQHDQNLDANLEELFITLLPEGNPGITVEVKAPYKDPGAFVTNSEGNKIAEVNQIERQVYKYDEKGNARKVDNVDTTEAAEYAVTYDFQVSSGYAQQQVRYVSVVDSAAPVIELNGGNPVTVLMGAPYEEFKAIVTNSEGNKIAEFDKIETSYLKWKLADEGDYKSEYIEKIATDEAGEYSVVYTYTYNEGKSVEKQRDVNVVAAVHVITLLPEGNPDVTVGVKVPYKDPGAFVTNSEGNKIAEVNQIERQVYKFDEQGYAREVDKVDTKGATEYAVTYDFQDSFGKAQQQVRYVSVVDGAAPVITLLSGPGGHIDVTVEVGKQYKDPGYEAVDRNNNNIKNKVNIDGHVNTDIAGEYQVYYDVVDDYGIAAETVYRIVHVEDSTIADAGDSERPRIPGTVRIREFRQPGITKGPQKPPPIVKWKGGPITATTTHVTPPKLPPGVAPKTRVYYKAKLPPVGSTVIKASPPKLPPGGISVKPGVTSQSATQPSDDKKKSDVKKMKPLR